MNNKIFWNNKVLFLLSVFLHILIVAIPAVDIFEPFDPLLYPLRVVPGTWTPTVAYEGAYKTRAFLADDDNQCDVFRREGNVLQLWQCTQDATAALTGAPITSGPGIQSQIMNIDDTSSLWTLTPNGTLTLNNVMLSLHRQFTDTLDIGLFISVINAHLKNVTWSTAYKSTTFDALRVDDMVSTIEAASGISLNGWERTGLSDFTALVSWRNDFPQMKPILHNVRAGFRGGVIVPTGERADPNKIRAVPFGSSDGSFGFLIAGALELFWWRYARGGVDVEFRAYLGSNGTRRVKTDVSQTDLLFLTPACTYQIPGFEQHYTIFGELGDLADPSWRLTLAYRYYRGLETTMYVQSNTINYSVENNAESLQEWTTQDLVLMFTYDLVRTDARTVPQIGVFYKHGFNGKRAIMCDSVGFRLSVAF